MVGLTGQTIPIDRCEWTYDRLVGWHGQLMAMMGVDDIAIDETL